MSDSEYVQVQRGGITVEVQRGEAQRYIRMGFTQVVEPLVPLPEETTPEVAPPEVNLPDETTTEEVPEEGLPLGEEVPEIPEVVVELRGVQPLSLDEAASLAQVLDQKTHPEIDEIAADAGIVEWKSNGRKADKIGQLIDSGRVYLGSDGQSIIVVSESDS